MCLWLYIQSHLLMLLLCWSVVYWVGVGGGLATSRPYIIRRIFRHRSLFPSWKEAQCSLNMRLGETPRRFGCFWEKTKSVTRNGIRTPHRTCRDVVTCAEYATPAAQFQTRAPCNKNAWKNRQQLTLSSKIFHAFYTTKCLTVCPWQVVSKIWLFCST
jgi:hypothetical protein